MTEGQTNDFLRVIAELRKQQKAKDSTAKDGEGIASDDDLSEGESKGVEADKDSKQMKRVLHRCRDPVTGIKDSNLLWPVTEHRKPILFHSAWQNEPCKTMLHKD